MAMLPGIGVPTYPEDFTKWWRCVWRRVAKQEAFRAWRETRHVRPSLVVLCEITWHHARAYTANATPPDKRLHPASWLRAARWEDELQWQEAGVPDDNGRQTTVTRCWAPDGLLDGGDRADA